MSDEGGGKQTFHSIESMKDLVMQWKGTWTIILVDKELAHVQQKKKLFLSLFPNIKICFTKFNKYFVGHQSSFYSRSALEHLNIQC